MVEASKLCFRAIFVAAIAAHRYQEGADKCRNRSDLAGDFKAIEPPPYATVAELRIDGWLASARTELAVSLGVAPELAFPGRLMRRLREALLTGAPAAELKNSIEGWRAELLREPLAVFAAQNPPPAPTAAAA